MSTFIERSDHGNIVILNAAESNRTNGATASTWLADGELMSRWQPASLEHFGIRTEEAAYDPYLIGKVTMADGLILGSGDQSRYVQRWKGTPLAQAIDSHVTHGKPLFCISAGTAVASQFVYTGEEASLTSEDALRDPYVLPNLQVPGDWVCSTCLRWPDASATPTSPHATALVGWFPLLPESSPMTAGRRLNGSTVTSGRPAFGLGINEASAAIIELDGTCTVEGRAAYVVRPRRRPQLECRPRRELTFSTLDYYKLVPGREFNIVKRRGRYKFRKEIEVNRGQLWVLRAGRWIRMERQY